MHIRGARSTPPSTALLLAAALLAAILAACSSAPQSGVTASTSPATAAPSTAPATGVPPDAPSAAPSEAVAPAPAPGATTGIPPKPGKVTFKEVERTDLKGGMTRVTSRVTWTSPAGVATDFTVFGVTECLRYAKRYDNKPCVVKGMRIPKDALELIAKVPGSARSVDISWKEGEARGWTLRGHPGPGEQRRRRQHLLHRLEQYRLLELHLLTQGVTTPATRRMLEAPRHWRIPWPPSPS